MIKVYSFIQKHTWVYLKLGTEKKGMNLYSTMCLTFCIISHLILPTMLWITSAHHSTDEEKKAQDNLPKVM